MAAMQLWDLCTKVKGDNWGGEQYSLLLLVMMPLLLLVVVDVVVVVVPQKLQNIKDAGGTGHQTFECCLKTTPLGQVTLSMWKRRTSKGPTC